MAVGQLSTSEITEMRNLLQQVRGQTLNNADVEKYVNSLSDARKELNMLRIELRNLNSDANLLYNAFTGIVNEIKKSNEGYREGVRAFSRLRDIASKLKNDRFQIDTLNTKELKNLTEQIQKERQRLEVSRDLLEVKRRTQALEPDEIVLLNNINATLDIQQGLYDDLLNTAQSRLQAEKNINKAMGLTGGLLKGLQSALSKSGFGNLSQSLNLDKINEKLRETAVEATDGGEKAASFGAKLEVMGTGLTEAFSGIGKALLDPVVIIGELIKLGFQADNQVTDIAHSLTLTKAQAADVREQFVGMSNSISDTFVTTEKLIAANAALGKQLGFNKVFSQDLNEEFVDLTKKMGLSEEAAGGLARLSLATGKSAHQVTTEVLGASQAVSHQIGLQLDNREIIEEVGKLSGQIVANFKANPAALAEAVAQAKALGTNLETTRRQSESLLDFESSIENQLKAELLTGKQINLDKARQAALSGDLTTVAKELNEQSVDFNSYSKMNVIQQKAFASALGLSSDELSDQLLKQQTMNQSVGEVAGLEGEAVAKRLESLRAQDKFNASIDKLKDIIGNLVSGPVGELLDMIADIANLIAKIIEPIVQLVNFVLSPIKSLVNGITGAVDSVLPGGSNTADDAIIYGDDTVKSGYGKNVLLSPEGTIAFNDKDTIVAGTNLGGNPARTSSHPTPSSSPSIDLSPLLGAIKDLKDTLVEGFGKEGKVFLDGRTVGTALIQTTYKSA